MGNDVIRFDQKKKNPTKYSLCIDRLRIWDSYHSSIWLSVHLYDIPTSSIVLHASPATRAKYLSIPINSTDWNKRIIAYSGTILWSHYAGTGKNR